MSSWHELEKEGVLWLFQVKPGGPIWVVFVGKDVRKSPAHGYFMRYEGQKELPVSALPPWRTEPDAWIELWPRKQLLASSTVEARANYQALLPLIDQHIDKYFDKRPYRQPNKPIPVEEIEHPTHHLKARIAKYEDELFEIRYLVYSPFGRYLPVTVARRPDGLECEWGHAWMTDNEGRRMRTMASDHADARAVAIADMAKLLVGDVSIRRRGDGSAPDEQAGT